MGKRVIKVIYFDFFGVIRLTSYWESVGEDIQGDGYFHQLTDELDIGQISWDEYIHTVSKKTDRTVEEMKHVFDGEQYNKPLIALADKLKEKYTLGLLSNASDEYLRPILRTSGLDSVFDVVVVSSSIGMIKPSEEIFAYATKLVSLQPNEIAFIDDNKGNVDAAAKAGWQSIQYTNMESLVTDLKALEIL